MDWSSEHTKIHFESRYQEETIVKVKECKTFKSSFTNALISILDSSNNVIGRYILRTKDYNGPTIEHLSIAPNCHYKIKNGSAEYNSILEYLCTLLNGDRMDITTSSLLTYLIEQMQLEKCDNTSCPEFLSRLVELGNQQHKEKIRQRQDKSTFQKTLEQLSAPYKKESGYDTPYKNATYPPISEENDLVK